MKKQQVSKEEKQKQIEEMRKNARPCFYFHTTIIVKNKKGEQERKATFAGFVINPSLKNENVLMRIGKAICSPADSKQFSKKKGRSISRNHAHQDDTQEMITTTMQNARQDLIQWVKDHYEIVVPLVPEKVN